MKPLKAFKLLKVRKDGSIGPLFINASARLPIGEWMKAEAHPTKGFTFRPFWHCTSLPAAPHLKLKLKSGEVRQWWEVEIIGVQEQKRPANQGGTWFLAENMKLVKPLETV